MGFINKKNCKTKYFEKDNSSNLISIELPQIIFSCDKSKIIISFLKEYKDTINQNQRYFIRYHTIFDGITLDSINCYTDLGYFRISKICSYIAFKTGDPDFGVEVYDFKSKQLLLKLPINGPSLTGIEFSPDDKYLITSNGPGANVMHIWDMAAGKSIYQYDGSSFTNIDLSHDGNYIVVSISDVVKLFYSRYGPTSIEEQIKDKQIIIYPNPTTGIATIQFNQPNSQVTNIILNDINGNIIKPIFNGFLEQGNHDIEINTEEISNGAYLIRVQNQHISLTYKLLINK